MLTVLDEYTRQALCVEVKPRMGSADVLEALYPLLLKHGKPQVHPIRQWPGIYRSRSAGLAQDRRHHTDTNLSRKPMGERLQ